MNVNFVFLVRILMSGCAATVHSVSDHVQRMLVAEAKFFETVRTSGVDLEANQVEVFQAACAAVLAPVTQHTAHLPILQLQSSIEHAYSVIDAYIIILNNPRFTHPWANEMEQFRKELVEFEANHEENREQGHSRGCILICIYSLLALAMVIFVVLKD